MRVGIFTDAYYPSISGVTTSIVMLREGLINLGHEVFIITMENDQVVDDEINIIRFKGKSYPRNFLKEYKYNFKIKKHLQEIKDLQLDIIHVHTEFSIGKLALHASEQLNIPLVYTIHTMYEDYFKHISKYGEKFLFKWYMRIIIKKLKKYIKQSKYVILPTKKVLYKMKEYQIDFNQYAIIPSGIDLDKFAKSRYQETEIKNLKAKYGLTNEKVLLYIGRIASEKSIEVIIKEFTKVQGNTKLLIVGDGPALDELKQLVKTLHLEAKVIFTGMVPWKDIGKYYQLGDIFVNASLTETQGLTYIEALASSLALVVRYDTNIADLIVDHDNGIFVYDELDFSRKINMLLENENLLKKLQEKASKSVEIYSKMCYAYNVLEIYQKASMA